MDGSLGEKGLAFVLIAVIVIAAVAVVGASVYYFVIREAPEGGAGEGGTGGGGGGTGGGVAQASSLDFKVEHTGGGQTTRMRYRARNIGTQNLDIRVDITVDGEQMAYILSGSQQKVWVFSNNQWQDMSMLFETFWSQYYGEFSGYIEGLSEWTGGEFTYSYNGATIRIYDIQINPNLPDSVFQPT